MLFGDLLVIPIRSTNKESDAMLYVQPVFVASNQTDSLPELKRVIVVNGDRVGIGDTLQEALLDSFLGQTPSSGSHGQPTGTTTQQVAELIRQSLAKFAEADKALKAGDLATYQADINQAQHLLQQASDIAAGQSTGSSSTSSKTASESGSATSSPATIAPTPTATATASSGP